MSGADPLGLMSPKKRSKKMSMKERRQKIINDRAARLARDAKKQGITPEQLLKKRRDTYINVVGGAAMAALPVGAVLRAANIVYKGFTGAKAAATGARLASKTKPPVATSAKKAPAKKADKPASQQVIEGKATVKPTPKPGTSVATQGSRAVKKPGTGVQEVRQIKDKKPPMKNVTPKKKAVPNKTKPAAKKKSSAAQKAALGAAALAAVTGMVDRAKDKKAAAAPTAPPKRPNAPPKRPTAPKGRPPLGGPSGGTKGRPPLGGPSDGTKKKPGRPPLSGPSAGGKKKAISAGGNTGFGPKGNIFPGNAKERAALMLMYGGTGSAAAKAAAAGKQGNIKLGRKALDSAKKERLSKKK